MGVSIAAFIVGAACFGHLGRRVKQRRRLWLVSTNLFQTLLVFAATAIRVWAPRSQTGGATLALLTLLSLASSGQIAMAVGVGLAELNTTMITGKSTSLYGVSPIHDVLLTSNFPGTMVQLCNDPRIFSLHNKPRNKRVLFYISLLSGCFIGAAARYCDAWLGLLLTAVVKLVVSLSFLFNKGIVMVETGDFEEGGQKALAGTATPISRILWGD